MKRSEAEAIAGTLGKPSKMPGYSYGLPAGKAAWVPGIAAENDDSAPPQYGCPVGGKLTEHKLTTCASCYALKGQYVFKNVKLSQYRRLKGLYDPRWVDSMVDMIYLRVDPNDPYFRWHDSGDLLGLWHLEKIVEVCKRTKAVRHWLPTREVKVVSDYVRKYGPLPPNLTVRLSAQLVDMVMKGYSVPTSSVHSVKEPQGHCCPAPKQGNVCGNCRACWDSKVKNVSYAKH